MSLRHFVLIIAVSSVIAQPRLKSPNDNKRTTKVSRKTTSSTTTSTTTTTPLPHGCVYEGRRYRVGAKITDNGKSGLACGEWGIYAWDNYEALYPEVTTLVKTTLPPTKLPSTKASNLLNKSDGCYYIGKHYKVGDTIEDYGTFRLVCGYWGFYTLDWWDVYNMTKFYINEYFIKSYKTFNYIYISPLLVIRLCCSQGTISVQSQQHCWELYIYEYAPKL